MAAVPLASWATASVPAPEPSGTVQEQKQDTASDEQRPRIVKAPATVKAGGKTTRRAGARELADRDGKRGTTQREMMRQKRQLAAEQKAAGRRLRQKRALSMRAHDRSTRSLSRAVTSSGCDDPALRCGLPGGTPDYFGPTPNWAFSPLPSGSLLAIDVVEGGSDYAAPSVVIEDQYGPGTGATATATVEAGVITGIHVDSPGTGYVAPLVTIVDDAGTGAVVAARLDPQTLGGGLRKFMDTLPLLNTANDLGQSIPVAVPDVVTYPGSDYYEIDVVQYDAQMHRDLPNRTTLRGYVQVNSGTDTSACGGADQPACTAENNTIAPAATPQYLGPLIVASKDRPVRIKLTNRLPVGPGGDLFVPVDVTIMGAGMGPDGTMYTQNRTAFHTHGGRTPWISDGTPHQWFTPATENTTLRTGESFFNVPDMPDPGPGAQTIYLTNQQSSRMLFYHDHAAGITRLNVYAGVAAGYLIRDDVERQLVADHVIPADEVPLVITTKTFVDANTIGKTDPTWNWGTNTPDQDGVRAPKTGDLWWPHVYMPAENPFDVSGVNATGRWAYGPWFWPPTPVCDGTTLPPGCIKFGAVPNAWYQPDCENPASPTCTRPWEPPQMPGTPNVSWTAEAFLDTPLVNGTAYPTVTLQPKPYRFRVLNADHDRFVNLQLYVADPGVVTPDGRANTEVKMVPAAPGAGLPKTWPTDGRVGGVPDPALAGPAWLVVGNEAGFLPTPAPIRQQPIAWNMDPTTFNFGNVESGALMLGPAERADVVVDFSAFKGKTLILYNDAPAPWPALDPHYDYYTGADDNTAMGGAPTIYPGYGPNTRTIMQIVIADDAPAAFDPAPLKDAFRHTTAHDSVFERGQDTIPVGQTAYNAAYGVTFPGRWPYWGIARISDVGIGFQTVDEAKTGQWPPHNANFTMQPKALHDEMGGVFDDYGRMSAKLGLEILGANAQTQNFVMQSYIDPTTEIVNASLSGSKIGELGDGTQIWKLTHNGVDTHPIHFHLFDVQLLNRVGWDGFIRLPLAEELGWKETIKVSPLEDTIVALRPVLPKVPFGLPNSRRHLNPAMPENATDGFTNLDVTTGDALLVPTTNTIADFGWEYVWHCHILSHEESDMMRPISFIVSAVEPAPPTALAIGQPARLTKDSHADPAVLTWTDPTPAASSAGDLSGEIGFRIERSSDYGRTYTEIGTALANHTSFTDTNPPAPDYAVRYRVRSWNVAGSAVSGPVALGTAPAPTLATIAPTTGPTAGGSVVTLRGSGFLDGAVVSFGGIAADSVTVVDATTITATTPAHGEATVAVVVANPDAQTATLDAAFTYTNDADEDGILDAEDCAPLDATAWAMPAEVTSLVADSDKLTWRWQPLASQAGPGVRYDILRGDTAQLPVGTGANEACVATDHSGTSLQDPATTLPGHATWYLVRGANACGRGAYGRTSGGTPRPATACP